MPLSPQILRPRSQFSPRNLPGLALWLDAADSSTLFRSDTASATPVLAPTDIPGCIGWWDASDAGTITADPVTQKVSQWAGKVGGRHFTQPNTASQPVLEVATLNGRNVIRLSSAAQMTVANDKTTWNVLHQAGATGGWVFAVFQPFNTPSTEQWGRFLGTDNFTSANAGWNVFLDDRATLGLNGSLRFGISRGVAGTATADSIVNAALPTDTAAYVASLRFDPNNATAQERLRLFTNGVGGNDIVSNTGAASSANASADLTLGIAGMSTTGFVAELIIYGAMLSYSDRARVERYLAAKWGVSDVFASASATNNPVGAWLDKSGFGRHATQARAASRPAISATTQGGRNAVAMDAGSKSLLSTATVADYVANPTSSPQTLFAWVGRPEGSFTSMTFGTPSNPNTASRVFFSSDYGAPGNHIVDFGSVFTARMTGSVGNEAENAGHVYCAYRDGPVMAVRRDGVEILRKTDASGVYTAVTGTLALNIAQDAAGTGSFMEFLAYAASVPQAGVARIERYLAAKWGVPLAPQVSNVDAQDWVNRVYFNGGTVSTSTASAVSTFCNAIDAAGIRDRFYRLNLFCATADASLLAVRTPLYRGPSLAGTQYGNALDTNVNFVQGDYAETGASGGLNPGATSNKYLNTGLTPDAMPSIATGHMSYWRAAGNESVTFTRLPIGVESGAAYRMDERSSGQFGFWGPYSGASNAVANAAGHRLVSRTSATSLTLFSNGQSVGTNSTSAVPTGVAIPWFVFNSNSGGTPSAQWTNFVLRMYSIGDGMTASQSLSYYNALSEFMGALSRS